MKIVQTPYIDYEDRNRLFLLPEEGEGWNRARLTLPGWEGEVTLTPRGGEALVPRVRQETCLYAELWDGAGRYARTQATLRPVKEWKVGFMLSSHEDLGYEDYMTRIDAGMCVLTELAMDCLDAFPDYNYFIEHQNWLRAVGTYGSDETQRRLKEYIESGRIDVGFPHSGVHTSWHGAEQLARSGALARQCEAQYGLFPKTALLADISGVSWAAVGAYAQSGVKYVINAHNRFRDHRFPYPIPPLFWWQAPNGKDKVLFWTQDNYQDKYFSVGHILCPWNEEHIGLPDRSAYPTPQERLALCNERLDQTDLQPLELSISGYLNSLAGYPWDVLPVSFYVDRQLPYLGPKAFCDRMAKRWKWPRFTMQTPTAIMRTLSERFGDQLPTFSGELSDQWSDAITASPTGSALKRQAERYLPAAETLCALTGHFNAVRPSLADAMDRMFAFDEHCWATGIKDPVEEHRFNQQYVKEQNTRLVHKAVREALACAVPSGDAANRVSVFWPQPEPAHVPVRIPASLAQGGKTLSGIPGQKLYDGSVLTAPVELPAFGTRAFALEALSDSADCFAALTDGRILTDRYELRYDPATGRVCGLTDRSSGRELIDEGSADALGDFLFLETLDKEHPEGVMNRAEVRRVQVLSGPLAVTLLREEFESQSRAKITTAVTLYRDAPQVDVESRFEDATDALLGSHSERYRKNIFYAFPLKVESPRFLTETPTGWIDERRDRLPLRAQDFVIVKDAVRVEAQDGSHGLLLTSPDMPVLHLGGIHYQQFNRCMPMENSHVYVYAASNRCAQLAACSPEDCRGAFRFSLLPYEDGERDALSAKTERLTLTPVTLPGTLDTGSLLRLDGPASARLCALFPTGEGNQWLLRVRECAGCDGQAAVTLPFRVRRAQAADITGRAAGQAVEADGQTVRFPIAPRSYTTLLLESAEALPQGPEPAPEGKVKNVFWYPAHDGRTVVCWDKQAPFAEGRYTILCDGAPIRTVEAEPFAAQFTMVDVSGAHSFTVEYMP